MKKLMTILAIAIATSFAMAQSHVDVITQTGPSNWGSITQSGAQSNYAEIISIGSTNDGNIYQNNNGFGGAGLDARISQVGDVNHGLVQQGTTTTTTFGHKATIDQDGNYNNADIFQYDGQPSTAYIRQLHDGNDADQHIYSDGQKLSSAYIWQEGFNNIADQNLGMGNFISGSSFSATQVGNGNKSYQKVFSNEASPMGAALKTVNDNGVVISDGNYNYAVQEMNFNTAGNNFNNTATITQANDYNQAWQYQTGTGHTSTITQTGNGNWAQSVQN